MDITGDSQYQCWNLTEKDAEKVRELLSHAQKYEAIEMRDAIFAAALSRRWLNTRSWPGYVLIALRAYATPNYSAAFSISSHISLKALACFIAHSSI